MRFWPWVLKIKNVREGFMIRETSHAYAKFRENEIIVTWRNHAFVY